MNHLRAVGPRAVYSTFLVLSFLICKTGVAEITKGPMRWHQRAQRRQSWGHMSSPPSGSPCCTLPLCSLQAVGEQVSETDMALYLTSGLPYWQRMFWKERPERKYCSRHHPMAVEAPVLGEHVSRKELGGGQDTGHTNLQGSAGGEQLKKTRKHG